tara:strand:- start:924 stop:1457 length:534 start_codon:yes stop_codon:yes gene_type:complete
MIKVRIRLEHGVYCAHFFNNPDFRLVYVYHETHPSSSFLIGTASWSKEYGLENRDVSKNSVAGLFHLPTDGISGNKCFEEVCNEIERVMDEFDRCDVCQKEMPKVDDQETAFELSFHTEKHTLGGESRGVEFRGSICTECYNDVVSKLSELMPSSTRVDVEDRKNIVLGLQVREHGI